EGRGGGGGRERGGGGGRGGGVAVAGRRGVAHDRGDQRSKIDLRGVEKDENIAGRRAGVRLADAVRAGQTRLETGRERGPAADAGDVQTGPTADGDEDDRDGSRSGRRRRGSSGRLASLRGRGRSLAS